ncbi:MAG: ubiquinone/menaquinone biosynthesis methyltransferase [Candidatus Micrarchaeota archaeon]|nr:ubiquinone/menaquinone biosynthesis methyltransferase [Candidatus Micrarchaeota archaeon]
MSERIMNLFSEVHGKYEAMNHIFSMGVDIGWRKEAAMAAMLPERSFRIIDIGTGTGDLALAINREAVRKKKDVRITGIDFNGDMLGIARRKVKGLGLRNIRLENGDALSLHFDAASFDVATSAFVLRNLDNLDAFAKQLRRVLRKGGRFVILEMALPDDLPQRLLFKLYFRMIMRPIGYLIDRDAYNWLNYSISRFDKRNLIRLLREEGFRDVSARQLFTGVGFIVTGTKP